MKKILLVLLLLPGVLPILANTPPRLVINLVVSSMRPDDIDRYRSQFGTGGFLRLTEGGARYGRFLRLSANFDPRIAGHAHHGSDALDAWRDFDPLAGLHRQ